MVIIRMFINIILGMFCPEMYIIFKMLWEYSLLAGRNAHKSMIFKHDYIFSRIIQIVQNVYHISLMKSISCS